MCAVQLHVSMYTSRESQMAKKKNNGDEAETKIDESTEAALEAEVEVAIEQELQPPSTDGPVEITTEESAPVSNPSPVADIEPPSQSHQIITIGTDDASMQKGIDKSGHGRAAAWLFNRFCRQIGRYKSHEFIISTAGAPLQSSITFRLHRHTAWQTANTVVLLLKNQSSAPTEYAYMPVSVIVRFGKSNEDSWCILNFHPAGDEREGYAYRQVLKIAELGRKRIELQEDRNGVIYGDEHNMQRVLTALEAQNG